MTSVTRLATALAALAGSMLAVGVGVAVVSPVIGDIAVLATGAAIGGLATALGLIVAKQRPNNLVGALLSWVGLTVVFVVARQVVWGALARHPEMLAGAAWGLAFSRESAVWAVTAMALLLLYFPDGRLAGRRWRWVSLALVVDAAAFHAIGVLDPAPYPAPLEQAPRVADTLPEGFKELGSSLLPVALIVLLLALVLLCASSLVLRFRRSDDRRRTQLKWLMLAGSGLPAYLITCWAEFLLLGQPSAFSLSIGVATVIAVPVATSIAILRYDLYDVDKALTATVTYGAATAGLLGVYTATSFLAGLVLGRESTVAAAAATAICAAAFAPLRKRLQRRVDQLLYPRREAALAAMEDLLRRTHTGEAQPEQLEHVLREALRDPTLRVGYLVPGTASFVDARREKIGTARSVPVKSGGMQIGLLSPGTGTASRELLAQVGAAAAGLVDVVRLRIELATALHEVEASRAGLVQVGDQERRRLERDLHDGAQQRLVALGMALRLAQRHLSDGTVDVHGVLDQSVDELGTAVAELREIAHGLRPSRLDDGLRVALTGLAQNLAVPIDLEMNADSLPDDVAATAYYVATEAVTNAVKYADAARITVSVVRANGQVHVRIADNGCGGAIIRAGSGLAGLVDRVAALGGSLSMESPRGRGTIVEALLPCA